MKKVTSYLVAAFALAFILTTARPAKAVMMGTVCGTIVKTEELSLGGDKKQLQIHVETDRGIEILTICNIGCLPDFPSACPVCATCYENCKNSINGHTGKLASFNVIVDRGRKFVQGQFCCNDGSTNTCTSSDKQLCYQCSYPPYFGSATPWVKCFNLEDECLPSK